MGPLGLRHLSQLASYLPLGGNSTMKWWKNVVEKLSEMAASSRCKGCRCQVKLAIPRGWLMAVCICIHVHLLHFLHSIEYNMMQVLLNALHLSLRKTQSNHGLFSSKSHIVKSSQNTPYAAMPKGFESAAAT